MVTGCVYREEGSEAVEVVEGDTTMMMEDTGVVAGTMAVSCPVKW